MSYPNGATRRKTLKAGYGRGSRSPDVFLGPQRGRPQSFLAPTRPAPLAPHRRHPAANPFRRVPGWRRGGGQPPTSPPVIPGVGVTTPVKSARRVFSRFARNPLLDVALGQLNLPGVFVQPSIEYGVPAGFTLDWECQVGPPANFVGYFASRNSSLAESTACLSNQGVGSTSGTHVGLGPRPVRGNVRWQTHYWVHGVPPSQLNQVRGRIWRHYTRNSSSSIPDAEVPVIITEAWPQAIPYRPQPQRMRPSHPDGMPDVGYSVVISPEFYTADGEVFPWKLPSRITTRDPNIRNPLPWYPAPTRPTQPGNVDVVGGGVIIQPSPVRPGTSVDTLPLAGPFARHRQRPRPSGRTRDRVKERKTIANPKAGSMIGQLLSLAGEMTDTIDAVWYALPKKYRSKPHRLSNGKWVPPSPVQKMRDLYAHHEQIDVDQMLKNLAVMQIQDFLIGKANQSMNRNAKPVYDSQQRMVGWGFGPAL